MILHLQYLLLYSETSAQTLQHGITQQQRLATPPLSIGLPACVTKYDFSSAIPTRSINTETNRHGAILSAPSDEPERFRSMAYRAVLDPTPSPCSLTIQAACIAAMHSAAEAGYPHEVCGLMVGTCHGQHWQVQQIRPVANLNQTRAADRFQLDPAGYQQIDRELRGSGLEIIGVYHSHPDCPAKPSPTDLGSAWEGFIYPIISTCDGRAHEIRYWHLNGHGEAFQQLAQIEEIA